MTENQILNRIFLLKRLLSETDYQAIKYAEGLISVEDYKEIKELRQSYRDEINELESKLKAGDFEEEPIIEETE